MATKSLFVSHISEEAEYAALLKEMIQSDFLELAKCFTSSDIGSIGAGENWLTAVERAMSEAKAVIVLCSKASVHRPWVQFEVGAAWMKGVPVIPVCHSGMKMSDLQMPLSLRQGVELPTERGIAQLYEGIARVLKMARPPKPGDIAERLGRMKDIEDRLKLGDIQQFELFLDIVLAAPGRLEGETIPDDAVVESTGDSLRALRLPRGNAADLARHRSQGAEDARHALAARAAALASPWPATTSGSVRCRRSITPRPARISRSCRRRKSGIDGTTRFHVHFVDTVVAPLSEVQNDFGMLATLLRLGLRFRYEVIERFQKLARGRTGGANPAPCADIVKQLREAIEIIENDALSRGAEKMDRDAVMGLFESDEDQTTMAQVQDSWDETRAALFRDRPAAFVGGPCARAGAHADDQLRLHEARHAPIPRAGQAALGGAGTCPRRARGLKGAPSLAIGKNRNQSCESAHRRAAKRRFRLSSRESAYTPIDGHRQSSQPASIAGLG